MPSNMTTTSASFRFVATANMDESVIITYKLFIWLCIGIRCCVPEHDGSGFSCLDRIQQYKLIAMMTTNHLVQIGFHFLLGAPLVLVCSGLSRLCASHYSPIVLRAASPLIEMCCSVRSNGIKSIIYDALTDVRCLSRRWIDTYFVLSYVHWTRSSSGRTVKRLTNTRHRSPHEWWLCVFSLSSFGVGAGANIYKRLLHGVQPLC